MVEPVPKARPQRGRRRSFWFVALCAAVGVVMVSAVIACLSHRWFALVLLYPALLGVPAGCSLGWWWKRWTLPLRGPRLPRLQVGYPLEMDCALTPRR